jgi:hypothetical protein
MRSSRRRFPNTSRGSGFDTPPSWESDHYESTHDECDTIQQKIPQYGLSPEALMLTRLVPIFLALLLDSSALGTDFEPGVAQNWAQFLVSEKSGEANILKTSGEPGRTRTCNPLLNPEMLCSWFFKHFLAS